ncbi:MAG: hypothetical protein M1396_00635 [Chloroflexi bacterium]|nr:hypothetical protein [Chloroflexota bacterium]
MRALLVGLTRYYLRTQLDSTQIPIPADDPRLLWNAIDIARGEQKVKDKRDKVNRVLEVAIEAIIRHHGLRAPSVAGLHMLQIIAQKNALSKESCSAIYTMLDIRERLLKTYQNPPRDFNELRPMLDDFLTELEQASIVLQERSPVQVTEQQYNNLSRLGD